MQTPLLPQDEYASPTSSGEPTSSSPPENATKANYSSDSDIEIVVSIRYFSLRDGCIDEFVQCVEIIFFVGR